MNDEPLIFTQLILEKIEERASCIKYLNQDILKVKEKLNSLGQFGIAPKMFLMGGMPRDFLLKPNEIKDLDIFIEFSRSDINRITHIKLSDMFNPSEAQRIQDDESANIVFELAKSIFNFKCVKSFAACPEVSGESYANWESEALEGIIKVSDSELNYPVDILLGNIEHREFVERLDFEICKAVISLEKFHSQWTLEDYIENFEGFDGFYPDIENKTLTTILNSRHPDAVNRSMKKHYPKLQKKYSDYTLVLETQKANQKENERLNKVKMYYLLEQTLEVTPTTKKMRKI